MKDKFLDFVSREKLISNHDHILVAVSGGVDSMVLCDILVKCRISFSIAHCNFGLRGQESEDDEVLVRKMAKIYKIECFVKAFDTNKYANYHKGSVQMAARELRYEWFRELMENHNFNKLATAHHLNDSLETALFNFTKGTGVSGLRGIKANNSKLIRPLLFATKEQILSYAQKQNLEWREDSSNESVKYHRNLIRNEVIPLLKEVNPAIEESFYMTMKRMSSLEKLLSNETQEFSQSTLKKGGDVIIHIDQIKETELIVVDTFLKGYGFNISQSVLLYELIEKREVGKVILSEGYKLNVDREDVIISPKESCADLRFKIEEKGEIDLPIGHLQYGVTDDLNVERNHNKIKLDYDRLVFPLEVRPWKQGDAFKPLGMKGRKKLSDFMIDQKIPLNLKEKVFVLTSESNIVWVIGHRLDDQFKITERTRKAFHIELNDD